MSQNKQALANSLINQAYSRINWFGGDKNIEVCVCFKIAAELLSEMSVGHIQRGKVMFEMGNLSTILTEEQKSTADRMVSDWKAGKKIQLSV